MPFSFVLQTKLHLIELVEQYLQFSVKIKIRGFNHTAVQCETFIYYYFFCITR